MTTSSGKTAAIIITGNEILSGKVAEQNASFLAYELRALGVNLQRIITLPDRIDCIAEEIAYAHPRFDLVFTSGGIGPTHDDVTVEGIAKGLGLALILHPTLVELLRVYYPDQNDAAFLKMASVPEGIALIQAEGLKTPILRVKNIYIFPGISEFLRKKFSAIKEQFREPPFYLTRIFINCDETKIAAELSKTVEQFPGLLVGSYPILNQLEYKVIVTVESKDLTDLMKGTNTLLSLLPDQSVWKIKPANTEGEP